MSTSHYDYVQYRSPGDLLAGGLRELLSDLRTHGGADVAEQIVAWLTGPEDPGDAWPPDLCAVADALDRWQGGDDGTDAQYQAVLVQFRALSPVPLAHAEPNR